jgi:hypothetical protein
MAIDVQVSIWLASKTRWVHLTKTIAFPAVPRVGEYLKLRNAAQGDYFAWKVSQITYREAGEIAVWTELLNNIDDRGYSFEEEAAFDDYLQSYLAEGWATKHGVKPNRRFKQV